MCECKKNIVVFCCESKTFHIIETGSIKYPHSLYDTPLDWYRRHCEEFPFQNRVDDLEGRRHFQIFARLDPGNILLILF